MVPAALVLISQWPLTPNGKIDKKALPSPDSVVCVGHYEAPKTEAQMMLVAIFAELLECEASQISMTANFFELGGHSLLAVRLIALIEQKFAKCLHIKDVFDASSLLSLLDKIDQAPVAASKKKITALKRHSGGLVLSSYAQQRLWFIDQLQGGSPEYNMPLSLMVEGLFCVQIAERALRKIIQRHESLRTTFSVHHDDVMQKVHDKFEFTLSLHDLSNLQAGEKESEIAELVARDKLKPFNLEQGIMLRAGYILLDKGKGILLFNIHHIASDGWSMRILNNEFITYYGNISQGKNDDLVPLNLQYSDYAHWQRSWLSGARFDKQLNYWQKQLDGAPAIHDLPLDFPRLEQTVRPGAMIKHCLTVPLSKQLRLFAQQHKMTPFMLLHSALSLLISKHSNSSDVVIGAPVANRIQRDFEPLIGFFANTLVLRVDTTKESVTEYLSHVKHVHNEAQTHQDIPFEKLVELCNVTRSTMHTPLFQILLSMNTAGQSKHSIADVTFSPVESEAYVSKFDLDISVEDSELGMEVAWLYDTSLFTAKHIRLLSEHFEHLLEGIIHNKASTLDALPMLSEQEYVKLTETLNDTAFDNGTKGLIHQLFEKSVQAAPEQIAMEFQGMKLSYSELNEQANRLAHYLQAQGLVGDMPVGLCVERGFVMVIGILGILKAGGAYVPLDSNLPEVRLQYMLNELKLTFVLDQNDKMRALDLPDTCKVITFDNGFVETQLSTYSSANLVTENTQRDDSLAYILYTSGSTGQPKGIKQTHRTISNLIYSQAYSENITKPLRTLQFTPYTFDVSIQELATCWFTGSCLVGISAETKRDLNTLSNVLLSENIERLFIPPAVLQFIAEQIIDAGITLPKLREIYSAGEELVITPVIDAFLGVHPTCRLWNCYGPTETHVVTMAEIVHGKSGYSASIGRPVNNTELYLLDKQGNLAPFGAVAELYLAGDGVALGYVNVNLDKGRFIEQQVFSHGNRKLYRTGDLVRYCEDGSLTFIGRVDEQVSINGFRVELGEIEQQLSTFDKVNTCVVMYRESDLGFKRLIAYIVVKEAYKNESQDALSNEFATALAGVLPSYMHPSVYVILDQLLLNANGKIDKKNLPQPESRGSQIIAPSNEIEEQLLSAMSSLLGVDEQYISVTNSFFELGLSSLKLFSCVNYINKEFALTLTVADLYKNNTVQLLAGKIKELSLVSNMLTNDNDQMSFLEDGEI
ncbi:MAG TPA: amino acid adenylation domain-containing protein [Methylophaga aminisulfidivorans]|uniref:Amino acid adenylation domain-containing protein n=2 Tax=root TaxID=1 RepID=A0A7C1ZIX9_9GAMM|nr:amino acid adenylation domain-containing protein [Methylophaga aminisulfidivorans]